MRMVMVAAATALLAGCATTGAPDRAASAATIRYETNPCFGTCPVYVVTVRPDGSGTFEGKRFTAVTGTRDFTASPDEARRFAAALAPYRPASGERLYRQGTALCGKEIVTDMPGVDVRWTGADSSEQHIDFYFGCGVEKNAEMRDALKSAPDALPIAAFVKPNTPFPPSR
jgi:hypothetical protein